LLKDQLIEFKYIFNKEQINRIVNENRLAPEDEINVILNLINDNYEEWQKISFNQKITWIKDELTVEAILSHIWEDRLPVDLSKHGVKEVPGPDKIILSQDYEGSDIIITIGVFADDEKKNSGRSSPVKPAKVVNLQNYRP